MKNSIENVSQVVNYYAFVQEAQLLEKIIMARIIKNSSGYTRIQ